MVQGRLLQCEVLNGQISDELVHEVREILALNCLSSFDSDPDLGALDRIELNTYSISHLEVISHCLGNVLDQYIFHKLLEGNFYPE